MQLSLGGQVLHGHHLRAVHLAQQQDAGIDRLVMDAPVPHPAQGHGAGPAIALRATLLGADAALLQPQIVQKRGARMKARDLDGPPLPPKPDRFTCQDVPPPVQTGLLS